MHCKLSLLVSVFMILTPEEEQCAVIDNGEYAYFCKLVISKFHFSCIRPVLHHLVLGCIMALVKK